MRVPQQLADTSSAIRGHMFVRHGAGDGGEQVTRHDKGDKGTCTVKWDVPMAMQGSNTMHRRHTTRIVRW